MNFSLLFFYLILNTYCQPCGGCINNGLECEENIESVGGTCDSQCKPKYGGGQNACYICDSGINYYTINDGGTCQNACNGNYILDWSKECISSEPSSGYKMGNVYYQTCPENSILKPLSNNECECLYKYHIELLGNKRIYHCLSSTANCPPNTYLNTKNNMCYEAANCNFISEDNKRCLLTCDVGEGFKDEGQPNKCLDSCPSSPRPNHNHGENKCIEDCSPPNKNIYHKLDDNECFYSCKDIDSGEFIYTKQNTGHSDYLCYSIPPSGSCTYYILLNDGVRKCVEENECISSNHNYIKGNECIEQCDYYKAIDNNSIPSSQLMKCFLELNECFNNADKYDYYNLKEKKCWKKIPTNYCINQYNTAISDAYEIMPITENYYIDNEKAYCCTICSGYFSFRKINSNECFSSCSASGFNYHIPGDNICYQSCKDIPSGPNGKYLYEIERPSEKICSDIIPEDCNFYYLDDDIKKCTTSCNTPSPSYEFKKGKECLPTCNGYEGIDNSSGEPTPSPTKECFTELNDCFTGTTQYNYYNTNSQKCWTNLPTDYYIKSENGEKKEVISGCGSDLLEYEVVGNPKKCITFEDCKNLGKIMVGTSCKNPGECSYFIENSKCVSSCGTETSNFYHNDGSIQCIFDCSGYYQYHKEDDYTCYHSYRDFVNDGYKYLKGNIISTSTCTKFFKKEMVDATNFISICYETERDCIQEGLKYDKGNKECVSECDPTNFKIEPETNSNGGIYSLGKCVTEDDCKNGGYYFYLDEKICRNTPCPLFKTNLADEHTCVIECGANEKVDENKCVSECSDDDKFFVEEEIEIRGIRRQIKKCIHKKCKEYSNDYGIIYYSENGKECLKTCHEGYYKIGDSCYKNCEEANTFLNTKTLTCSEDSRGCASDFNSYEELTDYPGIYICKSFCEPTKFKYIDSNGKIECLSQCPVGSDYEYHKIGFKDCIQPYDCPSKIADFESKECVLKCQTDYFRLIKKQISDQETVKICLRNCDDNEYITPDNKCIENCNTEGFVIHGTEEHKCVCDKLYYFDNEEKVTKCIENSINKCIENTNNYNIELYGTNQCLERCDNISSLNGEICYKTEGIACRSDLYDHNAEFDNKVKKCVCRYKFYIDENHKKHCLEQLEECPPPYTHYIPQIKQCVRNCEETNFKKVFKMFCLTNCPSGSTVSGNTCKCGENDKNFWYSTGEASFSCLDDKDLCPKKYPVYAPQTYQCLEKCKNSYYPYLYDENKCYSGCGYIANTESIDINSDLAISSCLCKKPWYFSFEDNEKKMNCPAGNSINYCSDYKTNNENFNLLYMIHDTKECVEKCPSKYPYFFNNECFTNCKTHAESEYHYVTNKGSYECQCKNLWYYEDPEKTRKICFEPSKTSCIDNIPEKPFLIYDTNECINICPPEMKIFNMTCYNKCPEFTLDIADTESGYSCSCNKDIDSYWYKYEKTYTISGSENKKNYYGCGVKECPYFLPNLLREEKTCLLFCKDSQSDIKKNLRNICVKDCPKFTEPIQDENGEEKCTFINLDDGTIVKDKETLKDYANVQVKELYESRFTYIDGNRIGGYLFNKFEDVSLQIYAIDKSNTLKEYSTKANLTYIDFDTCLPKIFIDNSLRDTDKILVAKYDLTYWNVAPENSAGGAAGGATGGEEEAGDNEKHIINKVEYELYNSRTMERIDASVCDPYEILVSYPIVFNKNRYNNYDTGFNDNEYKKKFDIGKKLHLKDNKLDTFNSNDTLYKDLCLGIEIDGKDLVLEDRYQFLYPNGAVLCESNCTFNSTDFDEERINCKCAYKEDIDFYRVENETNDLLNDPNFKLPGQSGSNLEVIKCLGKLSFKKIIKNNEAFYYCAAVALVVISMTLVSALYGLKAVSSNITNICNKFGNKNGEKVNVLEETKVNNRNYIEINKNENNLSTSNRMLSAPPKKNINESNNEDNDRNIINNKDIGMTYNINQSLENEDENFDNINNGIIIDDNFKAEYLPPQYNFKYFKLNDKGVRKQIERTKLPFKVNPDTKYLLERKKGTNYPENYLNGPFYSNQNIIEIIDKDNVEPNINNNKNLSNSKEVKYTRNINNDNNDKESPQKRNLKNNLNFNMNMKNDKNSGSKEKKELDFISIKKITFNKNKNNNEEIEEEKVIEKKDENLGLYTLIKREQALLRVSYNKYVMKDHSNILSVFLAEILDKVYLVKTCLFLKKFEIFGVHFSLYLFCHLLLLTLSCAFFTISTIKKIWNNDKYPGMSYYLLYGLITNIVVWVVYRVFLCLLDMQDDVKDLMKNDNKDNNDNSDGTKFSEIMKKLKCRIIIFYCIIYVFIILFALYLISFFAIYTGTKSCVLEAYIIGIVEILLIKLVYGICLASLRKASEGNELKSLYKLVYLLDKYVS